MAQVLSPTHFPISRPTKLENPLDADLPAENVRAKISYTDKNITDLFYYTTPVPGKERSNNVSEDHEVDIIDIRLNKEDYSLDKTGFQVFDDSKNDPSYELFNDEELIKSEYYKQVEENIKEQTGATRIFIFDHTIRRKNEKSLDTVDDRQPVYSAHVDQSNKAAVARVHKHLGDEAEELLKGRVQLINVWRPLFDGITDIPLAFADYRSISEDDLIVSKLIYPDYVGETLRVKHNPNHRWHYYSHQKKNDILLIKCYDSYKEVAQLTPHTAFINPNADPSDRPRESIEVRALVFYGAPHGRD